MTLSIIVAINPPLRIIGYQGKIPWHLPSDLKRFKSLTIGNTVVMGRKTFESIGKPLPKRTNIVLSRSKNQINGVTLINNPLDVLKYDNVFVIGGEEIYKLFIPYCEKLFITNVYGDFCGDTFFPDIDLTKFEVSYDSGFLFENGISYRYEDREARINTLC